MVAYTRLHWSVTRGNSKRKGGMVIPLFGGNGCVASSKSHCVSPQKRSRVPQQAQQGGSGADDTISSLDISSLEYIIEHSFIITLFHPLSYFCVILPSRKRENCFQSKGRPWPSKEAFLSHLSQAVPPSGSSRIEVPDFPTAYALGCTLPITLGKIIQEARSE